MNVKDALKSRLRSAGLDLVKYPPLTPIANHLRRLFSENDIDVVLDVGAYHGKYCRMLRDEVGYSGWIVSFEPFKDSFDILSTEMNGDRKWLGFNFGLSSKAGHASLNTHAAGDFNSLLSLKQKDADAYGVKAAAAVSVQLETLDGVWQKLPCPTSTHIYLKMDTQGHDAEILLGARDHLDSIKGLQSELAAIEIYHGMRSMSEMLEFYKEHGYSPVGFYPVNKPESYGGAVPEFDGIFIRRRPD